MGQVVIFRAIVVFLNLPHNTGTLVLGPKKYLWVNLFWLHALLHLVDSKLRVKGTNLNCLVTKKNTWGHKKPFWPIWQHFRFFKVIISGIIVKIRRNVANEMQTSALFTQFLSKMSTNFWRISFLIFESQKQAKKKRIESYKLYSYW